MDFETFSDFLMGDGPLIEGEETINFDSYPSLNNEEVPESLQAHPFGDVLAQESILLRDQETAKLYRDFDRESDDDSDDCNLTDDEIAEAEEIDAEFPDGEAYDFVDPPPRNINQNDSECSDNHCTQAELRKLIERTETVLEQLSMKAQAHIERQPLSTRILLANLANEQIFKPYQHHGSQARFSASVMKFLSGDDTIRRPGKAGLDKSKDGKLKFASLDPFAEDEVDLAAEVKRGKLKRKIDNEDAQISDIPAAGERIKLKIVKRGGKLVSVTRSPAKLPEIKQCMSDVHQLMQLNSKTVEYEGPFGGYDDVLTPRKTSGPIRWEDLQAAKSALEADPSWPEHSGQDPAEALANFTGTGNLLLDPTCTKTHQQPNFTPLADTFSQFQLQTPMSQFFPLDPFKRSIKPATSPSSSYSCSVEPKANAELALQPYNPVRLDLVWPKGQNAPSPEYLERVSQILKLYNTEARFMLSYFVRKYDTPFELGGGGPGGGGALRMGGQAKNEPPHALFRLGIAQYLMCKAESLIEDKETDELGLTPEARSILRSVWNEHPSMWTYFEDDFLEDEASDSEDEDLLAEDEEEDGDVIFVTDSPDGASIRPAKKRHVQKKPDPKHVVCGLNPMEKVLLARACSVNVATIEAYWDMMRDKTKAWSAMRLWCRARNRESFAKVKAEGRW